MWGRISAAVAALLEAAPKTFSAKGLAFLKAEEGFVSKVYLDGEGHVKGNPTIGYGHLCRPGEAEHYKGGITGAEAEELLWHDLAAPENAVRTLVQCPLTQNEYDALVSLVFNIGPGPRGFSGSTLLKFLNTFAKDAAADQFHVWRMSDGAIDARLVARRARERIVFEDGAYPLLGGGFA